MTDNNRSAVASTKNENWSKFEWSPLFMTDLPDNFSDHSGLAALASLLEEKKTDESEKNNFSRKASQKNTDRISFHNAPKSKAGGGKAIKSARKITQYEPYSTDKKQGTKHRLSKKSTTVGEAQLFLKMWKI